MTEDVSRLRRPRESASRRIWRAYHLEIILLTLVAAGFLLVFERSAVRLTLARFLRWLGLGVLQASDGLLAFLGRFSLSDIAGMALMLVALAIIAWRVRWRVMRSPRLTAVICPTCGGAIHRVHRRSLDRALSVIVPVRRYRCASAECGWKGLIVGTPKGAPQPMPTRAIQH